MCVWPLLMTCKSTCLPQAFLQSGLPSSSLQPSIQPPILFMTGTAYENYAFCLDQLGLINYILDEGLPYLRQDIFPQALRSQTLSATSRGHAIPDFSSRKTVCPATLQYWLSSENTRCGNVCHLLSRALDDDPRGASHFFGMDSLNVRCTFIDNW